MSEIQQHFVASDRLLVQAGESRPSRVAGISVYAAAWRRLLEARQLHADGSSSAPDVEEIALNKFGEFIEIEQDDTHPAASSEILRARTVCIFAPLLVKLPLNSELPTSALKKVLNREYSDGIYGGLGEVAEDGWRQLQTALDAQFLDDDLISSLAGYLQEITVLMLFARHQSVAFMAFPSDPASDYILAHRNHDIFLCDLRSDEKTAYAPMQIKSSRGPNNYSVPVVNAYDIGNDLDAHSDGEHFGTLRVMLSELHGIHLTERADRYLNELSSYLAQNKTTKST